MVKGRPVEHPDDVPRPGLWWPTCGTCVGAAMLTCTHEGGGYPVLVPLDLLERLKAGVDGHLKLGEDGRLVFTPQ